MSAGSIRVQNVSKRFRLERDRPSSLKEAILRLGRKRHVEEFWVLRELSLDVTPGEFIGLIGHNGSGKSTLLRLVANIHKPTLGEIDTHGRVSALLELGSGFHPDLTGRENVFLNGAMLGLNRKTMVACMDEIITFSGVGEFIDEPVKIYSSGMYVRLGFSVSVHVYPDILLVDEVIAVGDEEFQRRCMSHMNELRSRGTTIMLVSHNIGLIRQLCDNVCWLDHGRMMAYGKPDEVVEKYLAHVDESEVNTLTTRD